MNFKLEFYGDRIGPDLFLTHWMLFFNRLNRFIASKKIRHFGQGSFLRPYCSIVGGKNISIGENVIVRSFSQIHADSKSGGEMVVIENDVLIAPNVFITTSNHNYENPDVPIRKQGGTSKSILIKEGAWIAAGAVILSGVTIGKNSVVAAGAVVVNDVPDYCVFGGVPAKLIKRILKSNA